MKKPTVVLFTISNKLQHNVLGIYNLKTYALNYLSYTPKPSIIIKIYKSVPQLYEQYDISIRLKDEIIKKIVFQILRYRPQIIGFSTTHANIQSILEITRLIKKINKTIKIILGGPETYQNEFYDIRKILKKEKSIDIIVRYDGEQIFLELLESIIYHKRKIGLIKGIIYRDKFNQIRINEERPPLVLNKIPSPYQEKYFIPNKSHAFVSLENSRGCPYRCGYCSFPLGNYQYLRYFPLERVKKDLGILLNNSNIKKIYICDNNFNINEERTNGILRTIISSEKENIDFEVFFNAGRQIISNEMISLLSRVRINLVIGIQTLNTKSLKKSDRPPNIGIIEKNLKNFDKYHINYSLEFIFGLPKDSYKDIKNIINWIFRFSARRVYFYRLQIVKGSKFFFRARDLGLRYDPKPPYIIIETKTLTDEEMNMIQLLLFWVDLFYNNSNLREKIYQINAIFNLKYSEIFEHLMYWYKGAPLQLSLKSVNPYKRILKKADRISNEFISFLFSIMPQNFY